MSGRIELESLTVRSRGGGLNAVVRLDGSPIGVAHSRSRDDEVLFAPEGRHTHEELDAALGELDVTLTTFCRDAAMRHVLNEGSKRFMLVVDDETGDPFEVESPTWHRIGREWWGEVFAAEVAEMRPGARVWSVEKQAFEAVAKP